MSTHPALAAGSTHPPIFLNVLLKYAAEDTQAEFARNAPIRGFAAFLSMAETISGRPIDGAEYLAICARGQAQLEEQAKLRIVRGERPYGTITYNLDSENKETLS